MRGKQDKSDFRENLKYYNESWFWFLNMWKILVESMKEEESVSSLILFPLLTHGLAAEAIIVLVTKKNKSTATNIIN